MLKFNLDHPIPGARRARLRVHVAGSKKAAIDGGADIPRPDECTECAAAVAAAVLEEPQVRVDRKCFKRRLRAGAGNILGRRWVGRWKWTREKGNPEEKVRAIGVRFTLRGFEDMDADIMRGPQRLIASLAAARGWRVDAIDVK